MDRVTTADGTSGLLAILKWNPAQPKPTQHSDFLIVENCNDNCDGRHERQLPIILFELAYSVFRDSTKSK